MDYLLQFLTHTQSSFLFTSLDFWLFLLVTLAGFCLCYKKPQIRNTFLLACSFFFYYKTGGYFIFILLLSIILNFGIGIQIDTAPQKQKKNWMALGIMANLIILGIFKYSAFFTQVFNALFDTGLPAIDYFSASFLSNPMENGIFHIEKLIPPIGLSFFTFQAISYLIDLKRGQIHATKNLGDFSFYFCFFPQLVAGPIVRAGQFMPQLQKHYMLSVKEFSSVLFLILMGLVKKIVFADYISLHVSAPVFAEPESFSPIEKWMAVYAFSFRIYCDFSGYTDIAIGIAALFGFQLPENFRAPYKASSLTSFWRRWHISLSSWFRDYLYIPLGGNRHGMARCGIALMTTMLVAGFWHGAGMGFLLWGGIHGLLLCLEKATGWQNQAEKSRLWRFLGWFITFQLVSLSWILFRSPNLQNAAEMFLGLFSPMDWSRPLLICQQHVCLALLLLAFILVILVPERLKRKSERLFCQSPRWLQFLITLAIAVLLILFKEHASSEPFIYSVF